MDELDSNPEEIVEIVFPDHLIGVATAFHKSIIF